MPDALDGDMLSDHKVSINGRDVIWNELRKAINMLLLDNGVNEDKLLGPFFLSPEMLSNDAYGDEGKSRFMTAFENKVLLYLFEDAGKMKHKGIFKSANSTFADICKAFRTHGLEVFVQSNDKHTGIFDSVYLASENDAMSEQENEE